MFSNFNPNKFWDGRNQNNGNLVSEGTYYYVLKAKYYGESEFQTLNGYVQVIL